MDGGPASEVLQLLREVGQLREDAEAARGGVSLQVPEQEIVARGGTWELEFRRQLPVEGWNAQISILTGIAAAQLMLEHGVGILRTLPPATQAGVDRLRHVAKRLGIRWPGRVSYPEFVRSLDPTDPKHLAMLNACTTLFRGPATWRSTAKLPSSRYTGLWLRRTPTAPHRCVGSWTASPRPSAWRCARASRCRRGPGRRCPTYRR